MKTDNNEHTSDRSTPRDVNPGNFDSYSLPEEDDGCYYNLEEEDGDKPSEEGDGGRPDDDPMDENDQDRPEPLGIMLRTLLTPVEGWKKLKRSAIPTERFSASCFLPMVALASVSEFAVCIYDSTVTLAHVIVEALVTFISFYLGYYLSLLLDHIFTSAKCRKCLDSKFGRNFIMNAMATLALFFAFIKAFPMIEPVLVFLPLWTIYSVCRGVRFLRAPRDQETVLMVVISLSIILSPYSLNWLFHEVLPKV
jgi:hypothetical protein